MPVGDMPAQCTSESSYAEFPSTSESVTKRGTDRTSVSKSDTCIEDSGTSAVRSFPELRMRRTEKSKEGTDVGTRGAEIQLCG